MMKLTTESIGYINLFESLTGAKLKDCFFDSDVLVFLVEEGNVKRAIGKDNSNIKKISHILKKRFKILAFSDDVCKFAANLIYPIKADEISLEDKTLKIRAGDSFLRGRILGRNRENLKKINKIIKNYFDVAAVVVVA